MFSNFNEIKLEINKRGKLGKFTYMWKLNNTLQSMLNKKSF